MNDFLIEIQDFIHQIPITTSINILIAITLGLSVYAYFSTRINLKTKQSLIKNKKKNTLWKKIKSETNKNKLHIVADQYFEFRKTKYTSKQFYIGVLSIICATSAFFLIDGNILLAVTLPLVIYVFSILFLKIKTIQINSVFAEQMPVIINNTIKLLSKHDDMKTVIFEVSQHLKDPVRGHFLNLSRRMVTVAYDDVLLEFAQKINSIWLYAYVFLLMNYKKESKKSDIIVNLRILSKMLEEENIAQNKRLAERKGLVTLNIVVIFLAILGFFANLAFNDLAHNYFFNSVDGMLAFVFGIIAILLTVFINTKLTKKNYR